MEFSFFGTFFLLATFKNQHATNLVKDEPQSEAIRDFTEVVTDTLEGYKQLIPRLKYEAIEILLYEKVIHIEVSLEVADEVYKLKHHITAKKDM